ncbi:MAG: TolC family protein [Myxococcota bacterium]
MWSVILFASVSMCEGDQPSHVLSKVCSPSGWTIGDFVSRAETLSPATREASVLLEQARSSRRATRAQLLPQLQLTASYVRLSDVDNPSLFPPPDAATQAAIEDDIAALQDPAAQRLWTRDTSGADAGPAFPVIQDNWTFESSLQWSLSDFFLASRARLLASGARVDAQRLDRAAVKRSIRLDAVGTYFDLVTAKGQEKIVEESLRRSRAVEGEVLSRVEQGFELRSEYLRVRAQSERLEGDLVDAIALRESTTRSIETLLDLPESGDLRLAFMLPATPPLDSFDSYWKEANAHREELKASERLVDAATKESEGVYFDQLPDLNLLGSARQANPNPRIIPPVDDFRFDWSVGVSLTFSPNRLIETYHRESVARGDEEIQRLRVESLRDSIRDEVALAHARAKASESAVDSARAELSSAREAYRVRREQFPEGLTTASELIDTESELSNAELRLLNSLIRAVVDRAVLYRSVGRDLDFLIGAKP